MRDGTRAVGSEEAVRPAFAAAAASTLGTRIGVAALSFASIVIVARALGPAGRGDVALLTTIAMVTSQLARLGVEEATINIAGAEPERRRALATTSLLLALTTGAGAIALVVAAVVAFPAVAGGLEWPLLAVAFAAIPILIAQTHLTFLVRADYGFGITNLSWALGPFLTVVVNGGLALAGALTVATAFTTWVAAHAVAALLLLWHVVARLEGFGRPELQLATRTLSFGLRAHAGRVLMVGNYRVDQWFVGAIAGPTELGLYSVAVAWAEVLFYLPTVLVLVQRPYLVRAGSDAGVRTVRVFRVALIATIPLAFAMLALASPLCTVFFGGEFAGAVDDLRVLVLGAFGIVALQQLAGALTAQKMPGRASVGAGAAFATTLALDIALIPALGGLGAAVASAAAYTVGGAVVTALFLRAFGISASELVPRPADIRRLRTLLAARRGRGDAAPGETATPP